MLWALLSSAFVIYLYRKLNAEQSLQTTGPAEVSSIDAELDRLNQRLSQLETRLSGTKVQETAR